MMKKLTLFLVFTLFSSITFGSKFYVDPTNGSMGNDGTMSSPWSTLEDILSQNMIESHHYLPLPYSTSSQLTLFNQNAPIKAGDTLILRTGLHGTIDITGYYNTLPIYIFAQAGEKPIFRKLEISSGNNWVFKGIDISSEPYGDYLHTRLVYIESHNWHGPCKNIELSDCQVYSTTTPWLSADDWVNKASSGIFIRCDSVKLINNVITNIDHGIQLMGNYNQAIGNEVINFSGDGARILGIGNLFDGNTIKNCYKVDENHDDGIQSFTTNELVVDSNIVRNNIILNYEDPNQPLLGTLQGIGCFDGYYRNWVLENNLIIVNHWHGITFMAAENVRIINNTVLDPTPLDSIGPSWIMIAVGKNGEPSTGCIVKNNVANSFSVIGEQSYNQTLSTLTDYQNHFVDAVNHNFNLLSTSNLIDQADAAVAPAFDIVGTPRTMGAGPDIGAYEYIDPDGVMQTEEAKIAIWPNPTSNTVQLRGEIVGKLYVLNEVGIVVKCLSIDEHPASISVADLKSGMYFLAFRHKKGGRLIVKKMVIE